MKRNRWIRICIFAIMIQVLLTAALAEQKDPMYYANLSEEVYSFIYSADANGEYSVCIWSADGNSVSANVQIEENGQLLAGGSGRGTVCAARFAANRDYRINVRGRGNAVIEVARNTLSRSYSNAIEIDENETKGKMISRSGDAHWYRFTAESDTFILIACEPEDTELELGAVLMDDRGNLISEFETLPGGACLARVRTQTGQAYHVRVHSPEGDTGYYNISAYRIDGNESSDTLAFDQSEYTLSRNHVLDLGEHIEGNIYLYSSGDPGVCAVSTDGKVIGLREGAARITAYGFSSQAECEIKVVNVPIESIDILGSSISLCEGDDADVPIAIIPENASSGLLIYTTEDPRIASVSDEGIVTGIAPGRTVVHVVNSDGSRSDAVDVIVSEAPRRYRALLIGEENYPERYNDPRPGTQYVIQQIRGMLETMDYNGEKMSTEVRIDASRSEVISSIRKAFSKVREKDVSLLYISCHGVYFAGTCCLQLTDGTLLDMQTLESELREIPGRVILMLDCCASGGAIGAAEDPALFSNTMSGILGTNMFPSSKYLVLCSTSLNQDSYRISMDNDTMMTTPFARALCDAGGWDYSFGRLNYMSADAEADDRVSFFELYQYISKRVELYLKQAEKNTGMIAREDVCTNSPSDPLILFVRNSA